MTRQILQVRVLTNWQLPNGFVSRTTASQSHSRCSQRDRTADDGGNFGACPGTRRVDRFADDPGRGEIDVIPADKFQVSSSGTGRQGPGRIMDPHQISIVQYEAIQRPRGRVLCIQS